MAGSFDIFRRNQRAGLAALAIMAMIAFFILPPFLQMGGGGGGSDPLVVSWRGGQLRESDVERAVAMRSVLNRFLATSAIAAGRNPAQIGQLPEDERSVVSTVLLAREAEANGIVVSDAAINDFISRWTANLVRRDQLDQIIGGLRLGPMGVSQYDLFETLRTFLAAENMQRLFQSGLGADPPGWRWDYFRRLEQSATVEVVPVVAESLASQVQAPTEQALRTFFERYKTDLPEARSASPGFRTPHRARYQYLAARLEAFEAAAAKGVTDEQIAEFYDKNKTSLFRAKPVAEPGAGTGETGPQDKTPADKTPEEKSQADKTQQEKPQSEKPDTAAPSAPPAAQPPPDQPAVESKPDAKPAAEPGKAAAQRRRTTAFPAVFRQPADAGDVSPEAAKPGEIRPEAAQPAEAEAKTVKPAGGESSAESAPKKPDGGQSPGAPKAEPDAVNVEPLEKVRDDIRKRLARRAAERQVDEIFAAVANDMTGYAEDFALWQARGKAAGAPAPVPPDLDKIAKTQGLEPGRSELVTADQAVAAGGIGGSFELVPDANSRFGIRQQEWLEMIYGSAAPTLRPVTSRGVDGTRYLSWKIEDQPEFTPTFQAAREEVERAWRVVEARGLARRKAEEITAKAAAAGSLAAATAGMAGLEARKAGPFTWLTQGTVPFGRPPSLSEPEGISMPGEEFMQAVFGLEPGQTAVAFNEPQTVCYAVRLEGLEPASEPLRERFYAARADQRQIALVAQREVSRAAVAWTESLENSRALTWHREPR